MRSTVTDKGQITLPKALRDRLGIRPGSKVEFALQPDDSVRLRVLTRGSAVYAQGRPTLPIAARGEGCTSRPRKPAQL